METVEKQLKLVEKSLSNLKIPAMSNTVSLAIETIKNQQKSIENLRAYIDLFTDCENFVRGHESVKLGASVNEEMLRLLKERDHYRNKWMEAQ